MPVPPKGYILHCKKCGNPFMKQHFKTRDSYLSYGKPLHYLECNCGNEIPACPECRKGDAVVRLALISHRADYRCDRCNREFL